jgi:hypothetical protein
VSTAPAALHSSEPRWAQIAARLEALLRQPTDAQRTLADTLNVPLPDGLPAPVAAARLRAALNDALLERAATDAALPEVLNDIESELGITEPAQLTTYTRAEVSAWFQSRYMLMTARGLRALRPEPGDVVKEHRVGESLRTISSVSEDGRVYFRGGRSSWPNHLTMMVRVSEHDEHDHRVTAANSVRLEQRRGMASPQRWAALDEYALRDRIPTREAIRGLEELLEGGEWYEEPLQRHLAANPSLLASLVVGGHKTWVIPKQRLGAQYVTDFLVMGLNSAGPHWVMVELEAARHDIHLRSGRLSAPTRHAVDQIRDWRDWLTRNVAHAETEMGLIGLRPDDPGLIIIGRADPHADRNPARMTLRAESRIDVHSWDWLLRSAQNLSADGSHWSDFAFEHLRQ